LSTAAKHARLLAGAPGHQAAVRTAAGHAWIKGPPQFAVGRVERDGLVRRRIGVQHASDHDGLRLRVAFLVRVVAPCQHQLPDIAAIDLRQR
jgi:hypothetical protein